MGYSTDIKGRLVCDSCGEADGTVRRRNCPQGWCQPDCICSTCWSDPDKRNDWKQWHIDHDCAGASRLFNVKKDTEAALLAAGKWIRKAAVNVGDGKVKVTFHGNPEPHVIHIIMPSETYASVPIMQPATKEDYGY